MLLKFPKSLTQVHVNALNISGEQNIFNINAEYVAPR